MDDLYGFSGDDEMSYGDIDYSLEDELFDNPYDDEDDDDDNSIKSSDGNLGEILSDEIKKTQFSRRTLSFYYDNVLYQNVVPMAKVNNERFVFMITDDDGKEFLKAFNIKDMTSIK